MKKLTLALVSIVAFAMIANAAPRLANGGFEQSAGAGGNYMLTVNASDFLANTTGGTNTITFTNTFNAPVSVMCTGWKLISPFDSGVNTNAYNILVAVGDSNLTNRWINGAQIANDQTPTIYGSFGANYNQATTNILNEQTSNISVISSFTFTGTTACLPSDLTVGSIQVYFRVIGKKYP